MTPFERAVIAVAVAALMILVRISAIVDGCFSLIVGGETESPGWRWGSAQAWG